MKIFELRVSPNALEKIQSIEDCLKNNFNQTDYIFTCSQRPSCEFMPDGFYVIDESNIEIKFKNNHLYNLFLLLVDQKCLINDENILSTNVLIKVPPTIYSIKIDSYNYITETVFKEINRN